MQFQDSVFFTLCLSSIKELSTLLHFLWPYFYAVILSFTIAYLRNFLKNKTFRPAFIDALLCACITLTLFPILEYFNLNQNLAVAIGGIIAFLDLEWFRGFLYKIMQTCSKKNK